MEFVVSNSIISILEAYCVHNDNLILPLAAFLVYE